MNHQTNSVYSTYILALQFELKVVKQFTCRRHTKSHTAQDAVFPFKFSFHKLAYKGMISNSSSNHGILSFFLGGWGGGGGQLYSNP